MISSETPAITVDENGLEDPNFDGTLSPSVYNEKEVPQFDEEGPYSYAPYLPQNESEAKSAVEDLTQKLRTEGMARGHQFNFSLKEVPQMWKALRRPASMHANQLSLAEMLTCVHLESFIRTAYTFNPTWSIVHRKSYSIPSPNTQILNPQS
jgi:hypothetical protein